MRSLIVTLLIYLFLANANCSRDEIIQPELIGSKWTFETINNEQVEAKEAPYFTITKNEADHIIAGFMGCNRFQGTATITDKQIELSPLAMTRMYCEQADSLERSISGFLEGSLSYELQDNKLVLTDSAGIIAELYLNMGDI